MQVLLCSTLPNKYEFRFNEFSTHSDGCMAGIQDFSNNNPQFMYQTWMSLAQTIIHKVMIQNAYKPSFQETQTSRSGRFRKWLFSTSVSHTQKLVLRSGTGSWLSVCRWCSVVQCMQLCTRYRLQPKEHCTYPDTIMSGIANRPRSKSSPNTNSY